MLSCIIYIKLQLVLFDNLNWTFVDMLLDSLITVF